MIVKPLNAQKPRAIALLVPGWKSLRAITDEADVEVRGPRHCYDLAKSLEHHVVYVSSNLKRLIYTTGALAWSADVWRGRATTMKLAGTTLRVSSLRRSLSAGEPHEQFAALSEVVECLHDQGVRAAAISSMAWQLWRSTLDRPLELGFNPQVGRSAFYGGRQESSGPHNYHDYVGIDISKAYGHSMASAPYAALLREVSSSSTLDPEVSGLASANVTVPESLRFAPLPERVSPEMIQWRYGEFSGTWTWRELVAARSVGAIVEVTRSWAPAVEVQPFTEWWSLVQEISSRLSPLALALFKQVINSLWGGFAMTADDTATVRWADQLGERPEQVAAPRRKVPQTNTIMIAAETTSRVRVRMLLEGLYGDVNVNGDPVHIDTDGILVPRGSMSRRRLGDSPGEWRLKINADELEVRAPQLYRYRCGQECGVTHSDWHYVASGVASSYAHELFETHPGFQISMSGVDAVIPPGRELSALQVSRYAAAHDELNRLAHGPALVGS